MADIRIPSSPIHGFIAQVGDATHPAFVQLKNPGGSGKRLIIYELTVGALVAPTNRFKARRTASPLTLAGATTTALVEHRDETDASSIVGVLAGCTAIASTFAESASFWFEKPATQGVAGYMPLWIVRPGAHPIIVKAGSALELLAADNSATIGLAVYAVWDELA